MNLYTKQKQTYRHKKLLVTKGKGGGKSEKEQIHIYMYITESLCYTPKTNTTLQISCTSIKINALKYFLKVFDA